SKDFLELEKSLNKKHLDAFSEMIENLGKLGMHVEGNEVLEKANRKPPSPELIAEVLLSNPGGSSEQLEPYMKGGYRSDNPYLNFYLDFFAQGKPAHVKISYMDFKEAVDLVLGNGGIPIVAHPGFNYKGKEENASALLDMGAAGLEVFNNYHDRAQIDYFATLVQQKNALMTCGSDFHGKNKPSIEIGNYNFEEKYFPYVNDSILQLVR
ncbi:MAG: phosphatase, partial [Bacteroidales bacterium]|nr:phosphatase [Bacteroidales bacterium]